MPFGYLGVDIFFVISGYLITSHLLSMRGDSISFILNNFYTRRVKRLFPALFVFFFVTTIFVVSIFIRNDIKNFLNSLIAAKTFWSNIYFWRDGGNEYEVIKGSLKTINSPRCKSILIENCGKGDKYVEKILKKLSFSISSKSQYNTIYRK
jgi:hypothetical protein